MSSRSPSRTLSVLGLLLTASMPLAAGAQQRPAPTRLSLEEALAQAEKLNPAFLQQANDVAVAESSVRSAWADLLPSVGASTSFGYTAPGAQRLQTLVFAAEPANYSSSYDLSVRYQLTGATLLQPRAERAQSRAAELNVEGAAAGLTSTVTLQYLEVLRARERVTQAEGEVARTAEHVRLAEGLVAVGQGIDLDVRRARIQHGRAEVALLQARHAAERQILSLAELLGGEIGSDVELTSTFTLFEPTWKVEELVELAVARNPQLRAAQAVQKAAKTRVSVARSAYLPSISAQAGWRGYASRYASIDPLVERALAPANLQACQRENRIRALIGEGAQACLDPTNPAVREQLESQLLSANEGYPFSYNTLPWQASVTVSIPIINGLTRERQLATAKAADADARYDVLARELRLRQEVAAALSAVEAAYQTALVQNEVRLNSTEELAMAEERFRLGVASSVEVTDAQANLTVAERDEIDAVYTFHQSLAVLESLVSQPLRESSSR